ncbi:MAG TPA: GNAT family N-acetyltransferase [Usitatibacter sp.]|jgi:ribosomal protein S18 acetylase RimI-like enzyme|nr:GNAT family N-acetyltransferase [Usitatibacter sp.]
MSSTALAQVSFRALAEEDLPRLFGWLNESHVAKGYAPPPGTYAEVVARYAPRVEPGNAVRAFVVEVDGREAGYAQAYAVEEFPEYAQALEVERGTFGIDLFLAASAPVRQGLGPRVIRRFVDEIVFRQYGAIACVADPVESNPAAVRAFEKAGFARWKRLRLEGEEARSVLRRENNVGDYRIERIDLAESSELCIAFRREMYVASFGGDAGLEDEMGPDNALYLEGLRARIAQVPEGNVHLWRGERIVAQAEMRLHEDDPRLGYVSLFYVAADCRGEGLGRALHEHAVDVFRRRGLHAIRLSVSISNPGAMGFYRRLGWNAVGTRPNREPMVIMEYRLD